jgi:hypothetical protein
MTRSVYKKINGEFRWIELDGKAEAEPFFVHEDTLEKPLRHPVTGKIYDSRSEYEKETKRLGLEIVGEEKLSQRPRRTKDSLTEERIMDAIEKAESITGDPSKFRARMNENMERLERRMRLLNGDK